MLAHGSFVVTLTCEGCDDRTEYRNEIPAWLRDDQLRHFLWCERCDTAIYRPGERPVLRLGECLPRRAPLPVAAVPSALAD